MEEEIRIGKTDALIISDIQIDFLRGGALAVAEGNEIIPFINEYIRLFETSKAKVFAIRDWHPPDHMSFKLFGGPWPVHCLQESDGAKFSTDLRLPMDAIVISKAMDPKREAYSGFDGTTLADDLHAAGVTRIFVGGLATDYCIRTTVIDGLSFGFSVALLLDAVRGINVKPDDSERAIQEMLARGARLVMLEDFVEVVEIPEGEPLSELSAEKSLSKAEVKKKARLRSRGPYRKTKTEK